MSLLLAVIYLLYKRCNEQSHCILLMVLIWFYLLEDHTIIQVNKICNYFSWRRVNLAIKYLMRHVVIQEDVLSTRFTLVVEPQDTAAWLMTAKLINCMQDLDVDKTTHEYYYFTFNIFVICLKVELLRGGTLGGIVWRGERKRPLSPLPWYDIPSRSIWFYIMVSSFHLVCACRDQFIMALQVVFN